MAEAQPQTTVDWDKITDDILCPLCEYNLRLLPEPRCPECGYRFDWQELLDPKRRHHPFLFEHHPERKAWSFFKTLTGGIRPKKFWTSLHPAQPSHPRRLILYCLLANACTLVLLLASLGGAAYLASTSLQQQQARFRAQWIGWYNNPAASPVDPQQWKQFKDRAAFDAWLNAAIQTPTHWDTIRLLVWQSFTRWRVGMPGKSDPIMAWPMALGLLLWPWLTFLALMIFQMSMRRARVKVVHVLRCIIYSGDIVFWAAAAALVVALPWMGNILLSTSAVRSGLINDVLKWIGVAYLAFFAYRLATAYRRYLKFDWPIASVLSSQIIVGLLLYTALRWMEMLL